MSEIYTLEPLTNGKVLLVTSFGDIDIELWPKEAPMACRNFIQLCLEHYYDNCIFHRIIKDFMVQTGDPSGTGEQGESIYNEPFKDEFHSRLKFNHRGLVACANNGPHSNNSQFFLTLGPCEWLNRKHTIFGKVSGPTIFNLLSLNEFEVDDSDRPLYPPIINHTEVLLDPFQDIIPRVKSVTIPVIIPKKKLIKNPNLLSFDDDGDIEVDPSLLKIQSCHDILKDKKFSKETIYLKNTDNESKINNTSPKKTKSDQNDSLNEISQYFQEKKEQFQNLYQNLKKEYHQIGATEEKPDSFEDDEDISTLEKRRIKYIGIKRSAKVRDENAVLEKLSQFTDTMRTAERTQGPSAPIEVAPAKSDPLATEEAESDEGWLTHRVKFVKHIDDAVKDKLEDYAVLDPLRQDLKKRKK